MLNRCAAILFILTPSVALAQNFAPVPQASASPAQAEVLQQISFSSAGTVDPDSGPSPLTFLWRFGDGTTSADPNPAHAYSEARAYIVTLEVHDGIATVAATLTVFVLRAPLGQPSAHSTPLALENDSIWVVNPDSGTVTVLDASSLPPVKRAEIPTCASPRTVALRPVDDRALVACQAAGTLWVGSFATLGERRRVPVGQGPFGVAIVPTDGRVVVANQDASTVSVLDASLDVRADIPVPARPRSVAIAADGSRAYVTHYLSTGPTGRVSIIDLATETVAGVLELAEDPGPDTTSSGRGIPNILNAVAVDPSGSVLWVGGLKSNTAAGTFREGSPIAAENWVRGGFFPVELSSRSELLTRRIDTNDADSVTSAAFSSSGRYVYLTHQGAGRLSVYDVSAATLYTPGAGTTVPFDGRVDVGHAPHGVVVSDDGRHVFVASFLSRELVAVDVTDPRAPSVVARVPVTSESLAPEVVNGKRLFYRSREPVHSRGSYVACASCHADGALSDGRVWDFTQKGEGLRNTKDLRGRGGMADGPLHWSANFDEIQDFENDIVDHFGGTGLAADGQPPNPPLGAANGGRSQDLDDLAAYVTSLASAPASPHRRPDGSLTASARRGLQLFQDPALQCVVCHPPPRFTTSALHATRDYALYDIGTLSAASGERLGEPLVGIDPPSLLGLWDSAPYLHDGSAEDLTAVFRGAPGMLKYDLTAHLDDAALADLVAYLLSIDDHPDALEAPAAGCSCSSSAGAAPLFLLYFIGIRPSVRRRRT